MTIEQIRIMKSTNQTRSTATDTNTWIDLTYMIYTVVYEGEVGVVEVLLTSCGQCWYQWTRLTL